MGKAAFIGILAIMTLAGAALLGQARGAPATPAIISEVLSALDRGDAQQAANLAGSALKEGSVSVGERGRLLLYHGLAQELLGAHAEALRDFTQALDTHALPPDERAQALVQRGFLRDGLGQLEAAAADYTAVIAMKGYSLATALNNRANIYRRQNKLPEARRDYLAALSSEGGKPQYSYYGLGQIAEAQHDTATARGFYAKAVAADSSYGLASERLAALGGPPNGAIVDTTEVMLHPPPAKGTAPADPARGFSVATEATREADGTIVLRAPRPKGNDGTVTLHPPNAARGHSPAQVQLPPILTRTAPASRSTTAGGMILRPALDQSGRPGGATLGGAEVQLGAWRSEAEASAGWEKARARAGGALDGHSPHVVIADLRGKGRYYRLRVRAGVGQSRADLCASLTAKGMACLPVRN